jgi:type II secretory pathway pseudopilin PulG
VIRPSRGQEGFTLIELTVSLLAGLIVALGIVGLSKNATHTFHEEMRSSAAEANLRTAIDRLRADLSRAGYMSTGNIALDPLIEKAPGVANPIANGALVGLARLTSILLNPPGSAAATPLSAQQTVPMNPDVIDVAGNMTSTDQYEVALVQAGASSCGGPRIVLSATSPSMYRLVGLGAPGVAELNNIFQPTPNGAGQFIVRFFDKGTGRSQFLATCPPASGPPTGIAAGVPPGPFVDIDPTTPLQVRGLGTGSLVNPVQIVRWQILPATAEPAQYQASPIGGQPFSPNVVDPTKYDLVRSYVDAATGQPIASTTEIVAEYAVDLAFSFSVEAGLNNLAPLTRTFAFGDVNNPLWAQNLVASPPLPTVPIGPQRIRSVRVRLATRSAEPDRTLDVLVPNPTGQPFAYRYCVVLGGCDPVNATGVLQYARARTLTAEISLPNQSRNFY